MEFDASQTIWKNDYYAKSRPLKYNSPIYFEDFGIRCQFYFLSNFPVAIKTLDVDCGYTLLLNKQDLLKKRLTFGTGDSVCSSSSDYHVLGIIKFQHLPFVCDIDLWNVSLQKITHLLCMSPAENSSK